MDSTASIMVISDHCKAIQHPNAIATFLASFILVGILVSYLPQHAKIISRRSSEGLSPWWVLLGGLSSIAAIGNILTLPTSREDVKCCHEISGGGCVAALLGIAQIGCQWSCFMFIVMLFLIFFPATTIDADLAQSTASLQSLSSPPKRRDALVVGITTLVTLVVVGIVSIALVAAYPHRTQRWAEFLGVVAGLLSAVQYLPQIYYTWRLGDVKSLSILTMLIQVPGAFLFAFSLWLRVGWDGWSTWLVYIITAILQSILLAIAIGYFLARRRAHRQQAEYESSNDADSLPDEQQQMVGGADDTTLATETTALLKGTGTAKSKAIANGTVKADTQRSASSRQLSMLYAATPPDQDSESENDRGKHSRKIIRKK